MKIACFILLSFMFWVDLPAQQECYSGFYKKGVTALENDDFETAINNFEAAKVCPDKPEKNDIDAKIQAAQNGYINAIKKARDEAIMAKQEAEQAKRSLEALTFITQGQEMELQKKFAEAISFYSKAIGMFPDSVSWYAKRAHLFLHDDVRDFESGIRDYLFLVEKGRPKNHAEYYDKLAYAYEQTGQFEKVSRSLENAIVAAGKKDAAIYALKLNWFGQKMIDRYDQMSREKQMREDLERYNLLTIQREELDDRRNELERQIANLWKRFDEKPNEAAELEKIDSVRSELDSIIGVIGMVSEEIIKAEPKTYASSPQAIFSIAYRWSDYGACNLNLNIRIGGNTYRVTDNNLLINDLPAGEYDYEIFGDADCKAFGSCDLKGQGKLKVVPNSVYYCVWKKDGDPAKAQDCRAWLSPY